MLQSMIKYLYSFVPVARWDFMERGMRQSKAANHMPRMLKIEKSWGAWHPLQGHSQRDLKSAQPYPSQKLYIYS